MCQHSESVCTFGMKFSDGMSSGIHRVRFSFFEWNKMQFIWKRWLAVCVSTHTFSGWSFNWVEWKNWKKKNKNVEHLLGFFSNVKYVKPQNKHIKKRKKREVNTKWWKVSPAFTHEIKPAKHEFFVLLKPRQTKPNQKNRIYSILSFIFNTDNALSSNDKKEWKLYGWIQVNSLMWSGTFLFMFSYLFSLFKWNLILVCFFVCFYRFRKNTFFFASCGVNSLARAKTTRIWGKVFEWTLSYVLSFRF